MRARLKGVIAALTLLWATPAAADTVCEWMGFAERIGTAARSAPGERAPDASRADSRVALAMFEALNAIDRRYESYLGMPLGEPTASQDAAAVTAAYHVLLHHYPSQKTSLEENYNFAMEAIADPARRDAGRKIGQAAAELAIKAGGVDPALAAKPYLPRARPGEWTATQLPVITPDSLTLRPWVLARPDAVRPGPPPALGSARWALDYEEVRQLGGKTSTVRTPNQTLMARYRITPDMMPSLRLAADAPGRALVQNARLFALVNMAADDAGQATSEAKIHYNFWRPITAIRNGADDGNSGTSGEAGWEPLIATPNHPEYPCGHCTFAGTVAEVMTAEVGARPAAGVRVSSYSIPAAAVQVLPSWDDWVREVSLSRTLGGVHYRFSNEAGEQVGRRVARMVLDKVMRPLPDAQRRPAT